MQRREGIGKSKTLFLLSTEGSLSNVGNSNSDCLKRGLYIMLGCLFMSFNAATTLCDIIIAI